MGKKRSAVTKSTSKRNPVSPQAKRPRKATGSTDRAKARSTARSKLTPRSRELIAYVVNAGALGTHADNCDLETMAANLNITPARLRTTLKKLEADDYLTIEGIAEYVYPTTKAIRQVNPDYGMKEAEAFVRNLHASRK